MKNFVLVFLGSGLGGTLRYMLHLFLPNFYSGKFPIATFSANVLACLILGTTVGFIEAKSDTSPALKLFLIIGICGGFSTFSSLSYEMIRLNQEGEIAMALGYFIASFLISVLVIYAGFSLGNKLA
jgi:CrcB protein